MSERAKVTRKGEREWSECKRENVTRRENKRGATRQGERVERSKKSRE